MPSTTSDKKKICPCTSKLCFQWLQIWRVVNKLIWEPKAKYFTHQDIWLSIFPTSRITVAIHANSIVILILQNGLRITPFHPKGITGLWRASWETENRAYRTSLCGIDFTETSALCFLVVILSNPFSPLFLFCWNSSSSRLVRVKAKYQCWTVRGCLVQLSQEKGKRKHNSLFKCSFHHFNRTLYPFSFW